MIDDNIAELLSIYDQPIYLCVEDKNKEAVPKGGFEKKVLVLVQENDLTQQNEQLLVKMLSACQLNESDYYLLQLQTEFVFSVINRFQPETILLFGLPLHSEIFDSHKEKYKPFRFGGKKFLLCDSLVSISGTLSLKSSLWTNGLKPLFNIQ